MAARICRVIAIVLLLLQALLYHLGGPVSSNDLLALGAVAFAFFVGSFL